MKWMFKVVPETASAVYVPIRERMWLGFFVSLSEIYRKLLDKCNDCNDVVVQYTFGSQDISQKYNYLSINISLLFL